MGGVVTSQAKNLRTLEGVAGMLEEQGVSQEIIQAVEKAEIAAQENIAKSVANELANAEQNIAKSTKVASELKTAQEVENLSQKTLQSIKDILKDAVPGDKTKGGLKQYVKKGDYEEAVKDFYRLNPSNVQNIAGKEGKKGILPDGRKVNVRIESTDKRPTLEIQPADGKTGKPIKIRYGIKNIIEG